MPSQLYCKYQSHRYLHHKRNPHAFRLPYSNFKNLSPRFWERLFFLYLSKGWWRYVTEIILAIIEAITIFFFGIFVSCAFAGIQYNKKNVWILSLFPILCCMSFLPILFRILSSVGELCLCLYIYRICYCLFFIFTNVSPPHLRPFAQRFCFVSLQDGCTQQF